MNMRCLWPYPTKTYSFPISALLNKTNLELTEENVDVLAVDRVFLQVLQELLVVLLCPLLIGRRHGNIHLPVNHLQLPVSLFRPLDLVSVALLHQDLGGGCNGGNTSDKTLAILFTRTNATQW